MELCRQHSPPVSELAILLPFPLTFDPPPPIPSPSSTQAAKLPLVCEPPKGRLQARRVLPGHFAAAGGGVLQREGSHRGGGVPGQSVGARQPLCGVPSQALRAALQRTHELVHPRPPQQKVRNARAHFKTKPQPNKTHNPTHSHFGLLHPESACSAGFSICLFICMSSSCVPPVCLPMRILRSGHLYYILGTRSRTASSTPFATTS